MIKIISYRKNIFLCLLLLIFSLNLTFTYGKEYTVLAAQKIKFRYQIGIIPFEGFFVLKDSTFTINFNNPEASNLRLNFDLHSSSAGFLIATSAMLSEQVLYAEKYPYILFESKQVMMIDHKFEIKGNVTIRGITKPIILYATLENPEVLELTKKNNLLFTVSASFKRSDFNANGYEFIVGDVIDLNSNVELVTSK